MIQRLTEQVDAAMQPVLELLDSGLQLYRRGFVRLLTITAIFVLPLGGLIGLAAVGGGCFLLLVLPLVPLLGVYLMNALIRTSLLLQRGEPFATHTALRIAPLRLAGMGCYAFFYYIVIQLATSIITFIFACIFFAFVGFLGGAAAGIGEDDPLLMSVGIILVIFSGIVLMLIYAVSLVVGGATFSAIVYGLQPFAHHEGKMSDAIQRSIELTRYRLGSNLLAFLVSSSVFGALALVVTVALGTLIPLPLWLALGDDSAIVGVASLVGWTFGLLVVLPPVPIWMMLLYQRNYAAYTGDDLARRIAVLTAAQTEEEAADDAGTSL